MSDPDLSVQIEVQDVAGWLASDLPAWATAARFHARTHEGDGVVVLTVTSNMGAVGYAVLDRRMSHRHYIETRKDCGRRGVASRLWARVRQEAIQGDVTAAGDTEEGKRRLVAWGFVEADAIWTYHKGR